MAATDYLEEKMLNHVLIAGVASPANVYLAVGTNSPSEDGTWTGEISGNGYDRQLIEFTAPATDEGGITSIKNENKIRFAQATGNWGTITNYAIIDNSSGGNILDYGDLNFIVNKGDTLTIDGRQLEVTLSAFSDYLQKKLLSHFFRGESYSKPTTFVAACTQLPTYDKTGSTISEPSSGYARKQHSGSSNWNAATQVTDTAHSTNNGAITFSQATANWDSVDSFALCDAGSGGNLLFFALASVATVNNGDTASYADASISIDLA